MHAKTDSEVPSSAASEPSSPRRPVYYVQSPSRDSHDGEKTTTASSFHSSPAGSPPRSSHSRDSSSSRFSGSLKPPGARKNKSGSRKHDKSWKEHQHQIDVIEEEGLLEDDEDEKGIPRRCYFPVFVLGFFVLFTFFSLILWGASRSQKPVVTMKSITFESFNIQAGTDASLVATEMASLNSTIKFSFRNKGSFFGVHVSSTPLDLTYYQLTLASGNINEFYQSRKSQRNLNVVVAGNRIPLYGGGASLTSIKGKTNATVPLVPLDIGFTIRARAYVLGKVVKPKFYVNVQCSVKMDQTKLNKPVSLQNKCQVN